MLSTLLLLSLIASSSSISQGNDEMTPLQKHASFFDRDKDGIIYPWETFQGLRALGFGIAMSTTTAGLINGFLSPITRIGSFPSLLLPIYIQNIKKGKHGSDTGVYDSEGRFVPAKFEAIFQKHAHTNPNALTEDELKEMLKANEEPNDTTGSFAASQEWNLLYSMGKDKDGLLQKDTIRAVYDGSLFEKVEKERADSLKKSWWKWLF